MPRGDGVEIQYARANALDVSVSLRGVRFHVKDVGLGHSPHTISEGAGRASTDAEIALAEALAGVFAPVSQGTGCGRPGLCAAGAGDLRLGAP